MHITSSRFTYARDVVVGADTLRQKSVADLPRKNRRALPLVLSDFRDHLRRGDPGLAAAYCSRSDRASLVISPQYLAHAAVGHLDGKQKAQFTYIIYD